MMIADTDVLIDFLSDANPVADRIALEIEHAALRTTAVTRFELLAGARTPRQEKMIAELLAALPTLPLDAAAADRAALVRRTLERQGKAIGMGDSLIAGIVLVHRGTLLTRNRDHFQRVPGLKLGTVSVRER
ncbi:type II toxin-antitoxin system VapC family toxin [bacterium]|nr:type II toxin-antitoxin system VapC family toxin [bacterium]